MMKIRYCVVCVMLLALVCSCSKGSKHLQGMIPEDAGAVFSIDVESILSQGGMLKGDKVVIPDRLKSALDENEDSGFANLLRMLPRFGLDTESNIFVFFTGKTFRYVVLAQINDEDAVKQLIERETGLKFKKMHDRDFMHYLDYAFVVDDGVLFYGRANRSTADNIMGDAAASILNKNATSILDHDDVMACLNDDAQFNAYFNMEGLKTVLYTLPSLAESMKSNPAWMLLTDAHIDAIAMHLMIDKESAQFKMDVKADKNSDYVNLLNTTLTEADNSFLKAIPSSMQYLFAISVNGEAISQLEQVKMLLKKLADYPHTDVLDLPSLLRSIQGPFAIALAPSYMQSDSEYDLINDWNVTIAAKTANPEDFISHIKQFAHAMGQPDFFKDGRHVYNYGGKPLLVGTVDNVVYLTRLDHELLEGNYYDDFPDCKDRFAKSKIGFCANGKVNGYSSFFNMGFTSPEAADGLFYTADEKDNVVLALLSILSSIKMPDYDEDDYISDFDI